METTKDFVRGILHHMHHMKKRAPSSIEAHLPSLHLMAREFGDGVVVECGVGWGASTLALLSGAIAGGSRLWSYDTDAPRTHDRALKVIGAENPALAHWTFTQKDSVEAASEWKDGSVGLWFLDTSHRLEETRKELEVWLPKMKPDGIMCGHDFDWKGGMTEEAGVKRAVTEFAQGHKSRFDLHVLPHDYELFILWPRGGSPNA